MERRERREQDAGRVFAEVIEKIVEEKRGDPDGDLDWLPEDFAAKVMGLCWVEDQHARTFNKNMMGYLEEISSEST